MAITHPTAVLAGRRLVVTHTPASGAHLPVSSRHRMTRPGIGANQTRLVARRSSEALGRGRHRRRWMVERQLTLAALQARLDAERASR